MTVFEERHTSLERGAYAEYVALCRDETWPAYAAAGGSIVCLMAGLIGSPATDLLQVTRFSGYEAWERSQASSPSRRGALVESEEVRLLRAIAARPREALPDGDRRAVYGYRRFFIRPGDLDEFAVCSGEGVWPRIEAQGACILGLWTTVAASDPREVVLLTGYHGPAHWEETRGNLPMPAGFDPELWERGQRLGARRNQLTLRSWVKLMRAVVLDGREVEATSARPRAQTG